MPTMHEHPGLWYRVFLAEQGFYTLSASDLDKLTALVGKEATDANDARTDNGSALQANPT